MNFQSMMEPKKSNLNMSKDENGFGDSSVLYNKAMEDTPKSRKKSRRKSVQKKMFGRRSSVNLKESNQARPSSKHRLR